MVKSSKRDSRSSSKAKRNIGKLMLWTRDETRSLARLERPRREKEGRGEQTQNFRFVIAACNHPLGGII